NRPSLVSFVSAALLVLVASTAAAQDGATTPDVATLLSDGQFYLERGDCSLAQFYYQEALRLDPNNADAFVGKGRALACQGAFPAAIEAFQAGLAISPNHVLGLVRLANTYQYQYHSDPSAYSGRLADALDTIQRAEALDANSASVQNAKGIILYLLGDLNQARTTLERASTLAVPDQDLQDAERSTLQVNLGRVYRDLAELELA